MSEIWEDFSRNSLLHFSCFLYLHLSFKLVIVVEPLTMKDQLVNWTLLQGSGATLIVGSGPIIGLNISQIRNQSFPTLSQAVIIKLDRYNFLVWCNQLFSVVIIREFDDNLDGTQPSPPWFLSNPNSNSTSTIRSMVVNQEYITW